MVKNILCIFLLLAVVCGGCSAQDAAKEKTQMQPRETVGNVDLEAIDLNDLTSAISIPESKRSIKLARGTYVYTYTKKAALLNEKYIVDLADMLKYTLAHKASPDDAYSRTLKIFPAKDNRALKALESLNAGGGRVEVRGGAFEARKIIADIKHLNSVEFDVGIIPADDSIKTISKKINVSDTITVSGVRYKLSEITNNKEKVAIAQCLSMDVFYLIDLEIEQ